MSTTEQAYIYQADTYCEECTAAIKARLFAAGEVPANPLDERTFDSDVYPKGPYDNGGGEADTPNHCASCHKPLLNDLTRVGVEYVAQKLLEYVESKPGFRGDAGVLDGWADQLRHYGLNHQQQDSYDLFKAVRGREQEFDAAIAAGLKMGTCATCKWWGVKAEQKTRMDDAVPIGGVSHECLQIKFSSIYARQLRVGDGEHEPSMASEFHPETTEDFGCNRWKVKDPTAT